MDCCRNVSKGHFHIAKTVGVIILRVHEQQPGPVLQVDIILFQHVFRKGILSGQFHFPGGDRFTGIVLHFQ